jgi:uncharacterized protein YggE
MGVRDLERHIMKNSIPLGVAFAALLALPAWAADLRTISITGHGEARGRPDIATIQAGVTTNAPTAAAALSANSTRMNAVFAALKKLGVPERNIQTSGFSVFPQYTNGDNNAARRLTGYQVSNTVSVRLEDVDRTGPALDALVAAGANQMNGISFDIAKPEPLLDQARAEAVADARHRAEVYAKAAGVSLGSIQSLNENGSSVPPRPMYRMAMMTAEAAPVAPGEQSLSADVTMVWEIH